MRNELDYFSVGLIAAWFVVALIVGCDGHWKTRSDVDREVECMTDSTGVGTCTK